MNPPDISDDKLLKFIHSLPAYSSPKERGVYLRVDATPSELEAFRTKFAKKK
jgi:hypothetical protein